MKKIFTILILSSLFAGELEVEGNLTVTGDIDSPTIDALSGMKTERIYSYESNGTWSFTVPQGKIWYISIKPQSSITMEINNSGDYMSINTTGFNFWLTQDKTINGWSGNTSPFYISILEYSISGSGTEQGMDYIEP